MPNGDTISQNPYSNELEGWTAAEQERLEQMDAWLYPLSTELIGGVDGLTVVDIGGGPGGALDRYVVDAGGTSVVVDINGDLLRQRYQSAEALGIAEGVHLLQANAVENTGLIDNAASVSHMRAVAGWIPNETERFSLFNEAARITEDDMLVIDFDWLSVKGDFEIQTTAAFMMQILTMVGFDPRYGRNQHDDMEKWLDLVRHSDSPLAEKTAGATIEHTIHPSPLDRQVNIVEGAVKTLREALEAGNRPELARALQDRMDVIRESDGEFSLPDIHATRIHFS